MFLSSEETQQKTANNVIYDPPCKQCITFAICKNQMQSYLEDDEPTTTTLGLMQELDPKCKLLALYMRSKIQAAKQQPEYKLMSLLHHIAKEIFL